MSTDDFTIFLTLPGSTSAKAVCRTLMKLSPGINFINALPADFMLEDPKSKTIQLSCKYLFMITGSAHVKTACRTLMK
jgi:hypothetical protein